LTAPIAMSDGWGPGTALAATSGAAGPETPTSKVKLPLTWWPSSALTEVQFTR
jgi:hypothetical protein